ncbi:MAG: hypothetical protein PW789_01035 [Edaphobacter sp.]|uniref:O-antigen ligase family protein n=1 Tax=Edaphobacter sp. TaxID=1934404 RepID=UPI00238368C5|nr:O-antigen ligase family protein [Edaphobacter sp.]MDE1175174.1 hypothetical protein [Edaphobacter sp.]
MEFATLIPGILCILVMLRGKTPAALLNVFLPVLLLVPVDYYLTVRPIPPINMIIAVMLPLGAGMLVYDIGRWKLTRIDLWVLLFFFSRGYTEYATGQTSAAILSYFTVLATGVIPYMVGKLLIEQNGIRVKFVTRFVQLLFIGCPIAWYEYVRKSNAFQYFWSHFYPGQWSGWVTSVRWGFGRVAGPFSQSELAGMVYFAGLIFTIWLGYRKYKVRNDIASSSKSPLKNPRLVLCVIGFTLLTTQARGPWLGTILAMCIAWVGLSKVPKRRAALVLALGIIVGIPGYYAARNYASGPRTDYGSEKETAQYRAQLIDNYLPIAQAGGAWGWGAMGYPHIGGQASIDNEYLLVYLGGGYVGLGSLLLIVAETILVLIRQAFKTRSVRDRHFIFSLLGIFMGIAFTLTTVFLGAQNYELFFLIVGWAQSIKAITRSEMLPERAEAYNMLNQPLNMRVYT